VCSANSLVTIHGLCEIIERDAEAAWRRSGDDRRIVLETVADPTCNELLARCHAAGLTVWAWDISSDIDVPVMAAALAEDPRRPRLRQLGMYQGFGCHPSAAIALSRAISEAAQTRLTYIAGGRDDFFPFDYQRATDPELLASVWQQYSQPADDYVDASQWSDTKNSGTLATVGGVVQHLVSNVVARGHSQVIAVDLRQTSMKVPVVKVVVPGLAADVDSMG
jgi:YcaO-like protein with predicted kinase domain